jgi:Terpene synthase family 2, C-terminal metal binding
METITLPALYCPFESLINPYAEIVHQHTVAWVWHFGLVTDRADYKRFCAIKIGYLAARTHPLVWQEGLQIVADWCAWLFILDDMCDGTSLGKHDQRLDAIHIRFLEILTGAHTIHQDSPLTHALFDLRQRTHRIAPDTCWIRFNHRIEECFAGCRWEVANRMRANPPDISTYLEKRPYIGGLYAYIELMAMVARIELPYIILESGNIWKLTIFANKSVCWANDLFSFTQEHSYGDMHNLVILLQHSYHISLQEAVNHVATLYNSEVSTFIDTVSMLQPDRELHRYISILRSLMVGYLDWGSQSSRYQLARRAVGDD